MKAKLMNGDIEGAVGYFTLASQERYEEVFAALGAQLAPLVQNMQAIQLIYAKSGTIKYRIHKNETYGGQTTTLTYYIYFSQEAQGLWSIDTF